MVNVDELIEAGDAELRELQKLWPEGVALHRTNDGWLYKAYPTVFLPLFPGLDEKDVRTLAVALRLVADGVVLTDTLFDDFPAPDTIPLGLTVQAMQFEAYRLLYRLFPPDAAFWRRMREYFSEYAASCLHERRLVAARDWEACTEELAFEIARGKGSLAKSVVAGLAELGHNDRFLSVLTQSLEQFYLGLQFFDDLRDWKPDLQRGAPSLVLWRLMAAQSHINETSNGHVLEQLAKELYYGGHARDALRAAISHLDEAKRLVIDLPLDTWRERIADLRSHCERALSDIERITESNTAPKEAQRALIPELPTPKSRCQAIAWDGLAFLLKEWCKGFGEARHLMAYPDAFDPDRRREMQFGDVFQRAIIADALCDADELLAGAVRGIIHSEVSYILSQELRDGFGGWSYFPGLKELPPDADDLAQVIQVLVRGGLSSSEIDARAAKPLRVAFDDCVHEDGSFDTWLVPQHNRSAAQRRHWEGCGALWGKGSDVEVVANLIFALSLYPSNQFVEQRERAADWIERMQEPDSRWSSKRWYIGPQYSTYVCLRALNAMRPASSAVMRGAAFMRDSQHDDGGWGMLPTMASDCLSTAFGLLALASVAAPNSVATGDVTRATRGLRYLEDNRDDRQAWPKVGFIRIWDTSYGSRTITTAYVMKAALAWHVRAPEAFSLPSPDA